MSAVDVRPVNAAALDAIAAVMAAAFDPVYGEAWTPGQTIAVVGLPGYALWGGWADGHNAMAGFAVTRTVAGESELLLLGVDPLLRRRGVGGALIAAWTAACREQGVTRQFLEMRSDNPARSLYVAHGFEPVAVRPGYYRGADGQLRDAQTMQRQL